MAAIAKGPWLLFWDFEDFEDFEGSGLEPARTSIAFFYEPNFDAAPGMHWTLQNAYPH